ncbi:MAG: Flp family type IVb pilin [Brevundimonas sp.]|nr:MAG: Flp family type IVb pilin [Brevundimonas sp.]
MKVFLIRFHTDESGATAIEYGLIAALMCVACLTAFAAFGTAGENLINQTMDAIRTAIAGAA